MTARELGEHIDTRRLRRLIHGIHILLLMSVIAVAGSAGMFSRTKAAELGDRSLTVASAAPSAVTEHSFMLTFVTPLDIGSISLEYCQESPLFDYSCSAPLGLDLSAASLNSQTGEIGFSIHGSSTADKIILTRTASTLVPGVSTYTFSNIVNPSTENTAAFVRVATYESDDATGARVDEGGLAFAVAKPLNVEAYVPPFIIMCVGVTVALDCSTATGNSLNLGNLSSNSPRSATSQFAVATNDDAGYNAFVLGTTMTSGVNTIPANATQQPSTPGTGQFGINLVANTNPSAGGVPSGSGTGIPNTLYDDQNLFRFQNGELIASSPLPTEFNRFTMTYIVNVPGSQPPGIYSTTMTILGVADF